MTLSTWNDRTLNHFIPTVPSYKRQTLVIFYYSSYPLLPFVNLLLTFELKKGVFYGLFSYKIRKKNEDVNLMLYTEE